MPHAHTGHGGGEGRRAGRGDALGIHMAHRRRLRCRPALRPLHTARSISTTAALAAAAESSHLHVHLHLHAAVAVPPLPLMPARSPAARRLTAAEQRLPLLGLGSELGVGFRAGGVR